MNIAYTRLRNQHIALPTFGKPGEAVAYMGAVQAQDYAGARWAVGQRIQGSTDASIDQALADAVILRTHVLRPTWHFVAPADIRWMLALTAPRVNAASAYWYRKLELDDSLFARSNRVITKALQGSKQLTRRELGLALAEAAIATDDLLRLTYIVGAAELEGIVCSGGLRGKQFTYALLDERVPQTAPLPREEALANLTARYFTSHGPATLQDFVWWSGLTTRDAKAGIGIVTSQLAQEVIDGQTYWFSGIAPPPREEGDEAEAVYLLPNYDEYIVGYKDRSAIFDAAHTEKLDARGNVLFNHTVVAGGQVVGTWKRTLKSNSVVVEAALFALLDDKQSAGLETAVERYGQFIGVPAELRV